MSSEGDDLYDNLDSGAFSPSHEAGEDGNEAMDDLLYGDLDDELPHDRIARLEGQIADQTQQIATLHEEQLESQNRENKLTEENAKLKAELAKSKATAAKLKHNLSRFILTSKTEINRKNEANKKAMDQLNESYSKKFDKANIKREYRRVLNEVLKSFNLDKDFKRLKVKLPTSPVRVQVPSSTGDPSSTTDPQPSTSRACQEELRSFKATKAAQEDDHCSTRKEQRPKRNQDKKPIEDENKVESSSHPARSSGGQPEERPRPEGQESSRRKVKNKATATKSDDKEDSKDVKQPSVSERLQALSSSGDNGSPSRRRREGRDSRDRRPERESSRSHRRRSRSRERRGDHKRPHSPSPTKRSRKDELKNAASPARSTRSSSSSSLHRREDLKERTVASSPARSTSSSISSKSSRKENETPTKNRSKQKEIPSDKKLTEKPSEKKDKIPVETSEVVEDKQVVEKNDKPTEDDLEEGEITSSDDEEEVVPKPVEKKQVQTKQVETEPVKTKPVEAKKVTKPENKRDSEPLRRSPRKKNMNTEDKSEKPSLSQWKNLGMKESASKKDSVKDKLETSKAEKVTERRPLSNVAQAVIQASIKAHKDEKSKKTGGNSKVVEDKNPKSSSDAKSLKKDEISSSKEASKQDKNTDNEKTAIKDLAEASKSAKNTDVEEKKGDTESNKNGVTNIAPVSKAVGTTSRVTRSKGKDINNLKEACEANKDTEDIHEENNDETENVSNTDSNKNDEPEQTGSSPGSLKIRVKVSNASMNESEAPTSEVLDTCSNSNSSNSNPVQSVAKLLSNFDQELVKELASADIERKIRKRRRAYSKLLSEQEKIIERVSGSSGTEREEETKSRSKRKLTSPAETGSEAKRPKPVFTTPTKKNKDRKQRMAELFGEDTPEKQVQVQSALDEEYFSPPKHPINYSTNRRKSRVLRKRSSTDSESDEVLDLASPTGIAKILKEELYNAQIGPGGMICTPTSVRSRSRTSSVCSSGGDTTPRRSPRVLNSARQTLETIAEAGHSTPKRQVQQHEVEVAAMIASAATSVTSTPSVNTSVHDETANLSMEDAFMKHNSQTSSPNQNTETANTNMLREDLLLSEGDTTTAKTPARIEVNNSSSVDVEANRQMVRDDLMLSDAETTCSPILEEKDSKNNSNSKSTVDSNEKSIPSTNDSTNKIECGEITNDKNKESVTCDEKVENEKLPSNESSDESSKDSSDTNALNSSNDDTQKKPHGKEINGGATDEKAQCSDEENKENEVGNKVSVQDTEQKVEQSSKPLTKKEQGKLFFETKAKIKELQEIERKERADGIEITEEVKLERTKLYDELEAKVIMLKRLKAERDLAREQEKRKSEEKKREKSSKSKDEKDKKKKDKKEKKKRKKEKKDKDKKSKSKKEDSSKDSKSKKNLSDNSKEKKRLKKLEKVEKLASKKAKKAKAKKESK